MNRSMEESLVGFGRFLREQGISVSPAQSLEAARAAALVGPERPLDLGNALKASLTLDRESFHNFDRLFWRYFWRGEEEEEPRDEEGGGAGGDWRARSGQSCQSHTPPQSDRSPASSQEILGRGGFCRPGEGQELARDLLAILAPLLKRLSRRRRAGGREDLLLRATIRKSLKTHGEPVELIWAAKKPKTRRLVVLADVSGSMELSTPHLLEFLAAVAGAGRQAEVFAFATRLTRLTPWLRPVGRGGGERLEKLKTRIPDLAGGTRLGPCLGQLLRRHGALLGTGSILVVVSDGWDRGEPATLAREMERVSRRVKRVVWLNPLLASDNYRPVNRGMAAALPFVDHFLPCHDLAAWARVAGVLTGLLK